MKSQHTMFSFPIQTHASTGQKEEQNRKKKKGQNKKDTFNSITPTLLPNTKFTLSTSNEHRKLTDTILGSKDFIE